MICQVAGCEEHYACRLRAKGLHFSATATPTARASSAPPRTPDPAWERGIVGERRPDGSFMPVLRPGSVGTPLRVHEHSSIRGQVDEGIKRLKTDPHVFTPRS